MNLEMMTVTVGSSFHRVREKAPALGHGWTVKSLPPPMADTSAFEICLDGIDLTHCCLCLRETAADRLWQHVLGLPFIRLYQTIEQPANVPWLAVYLLQGAFDFVKAGHQKKLLKLANLEAGVAWTLIEEYHVDRGATPVDRIPGLWPNPNRFH